MIIKEFEPGAECSKNFVFDKPITSMQELDEVLQTQPSIFWNHRPFPCAVVVNQSFIVLRGAIRFKRLWTIKAKSKS